MLIELLEKATVIQPPRNYIGASIIGHSCDRYIWLNKYGDVPVTLSLRKQRIFERGHLEEPRLLTRINLLKEWTIEHLQYEVITEHLRGHIDAILRYEDGTLYILEIKTMSQKKFKELLRKGLKEISFTYWAQCQVYLYLQNIQKAIVLVVNKNTEDLYEEIIEKKPSVGEDFINKAKRIDERKEMPLGLMGCNMKQFECFGCAYESFCFKEIPIVPFAEERSIFG